MTRQVGTPLKPPASRAWIWIQDPRQGNESATVSWIVDSVRSQPPGLASVGIGASARAVVPRVTFDAGLHQKGRFGRSITAALAGEKSMPLASRLEHARWRLTGFETIPIIDRRPMRRDPGRFFRYWFCRAAMERKSARIGRPLRVLEVGLGDGSMFGFLGGPRIGTDRFGLPSWVERWDGLDVKLQTRALARYAYSDLIEADIETLRPFGRRYDAVVLIHVLEHLFSPEVALTRAAALLTEEGSIVGGSPTMPAPIASVHEHWLRWKHRRIFENIRMHRHLSVVSPGRIRRFARRTGMKVDLLAGAFLLRSTGFLFEDFELWARANLLWGALLPALGGELYFSLRKGTVEAASHEVRALPLPQR